MISINKRRLYGEVYNEVRCLSDDEKPTDVKNGSILIEIDTGDTYMFDADGAVWNQLPSSGGGGGGGNEPKPSSTAPKMDGTASSGSSLLYARADHVHPTDTSRASTAVATTSANGLMSATDKAKLDGIESGANAYTLPTMSATTKGGAKLGDGLALTDGALGIDPEPQESTGEVRGAIASLTAKGWATQDGTPTPSNPVPIQVARGRNLIGEESKIFRVLIGNLNQGIGLTDSDGGTSYKVAIRKNTDYVIRDYTSYACNRFRIALFADEPSTTRVNNVSELVNDSSISPREYAFNSGNYEWLVFTIDSQAMLANAKVQLELGSTPTPYVPYGHVGVEVRGRNLLDSSRYGAAANIAIGNYSNFTTFTINGVTFTRNSDGSLYASGTASAVTVIYLPLAHELPIGTQIALSGCPSGGSTSTFQVDPYYTDNTFDAGDVGSGFSKTITKPLNRVRIRIASGQSISKTFYPQLELGSVAHSYQPCFNETIPVPLPSKGYAASLPDGTADVLTIDGAGKVEWVSATGMVTFDGSSDETWKLSGGGGLRVYENSIIASSPSGTSVVTPSICTHFVATSANDTYNGILGFAVQDGKVNFSTGTGAMVVADWTAWLAQNPVTVLYPLATPVTEQCGYLDWPSIPDGATITCPELDALGVRYLIGNGVSEMAREWYERGHAEAQSNATALGELAQSVLDVDGKADAVAAQLVAEDVSSDVKAVLGLSPRPTWYPSKAYKILGLVWFIASFKSLGNAFGPTSTNVLELTGPTAISSRLGITKFPVHTNIPNINASIETSQGGTYVTLASQDGNSVTIPNGTDCIISGIYYVG